MTRVPATEYRREYPGPAGWLGRVAYAVGWVAGFVLGGLPGAVRLDDRETQDARP